MRGQQFFESDPSEGNFPRGSDTFERALQIWQDPDHIESVIQTEDRSRQVAIGKLRDGSCITAIFSIEANRLHLLSVRKSLPQEVRCRERSYNASPDGIRRVNVDFPYWMVQALDREAQRIGISRQAIVKTWLAQRLSLRRDPSF